MTAKTIDLPISPVGISLGFFQKCFAHDSVALGREYFSFQVLDFEILFLLIDDDRPAVFGQGLGGDVGANVENLWQAEERAFGIFDRVHDVVAEGWEVRACSRNSGRCRGVGGLRALWDSPRGAASMLSFSDTPWAWRSGRRAWLGRIEQPRGRRRRWSGGLRR